MWYGYSLEGLKNNETDTEYFDIKSSPFKIYGLCNPQVNYYRLPVDVAKSVGGVAPHSETAQAGE